MLKRKMRTRITEDDKQIIREALVKNEWKVRETFRELQENGGNYGRGTIGKIAKDEKDSEGLLSRLTAAEARIRSQQSTITNLRRMYGQALEISDDLLASVQKLPVPKPIVPMKTKISTTSTPVCVPIADWHVGEVIDNNEMDGFNRYDYDVAERRVRYLANKVNDWIQTERHGHVINELHIPIAGDMITGNIHEELVTYAEFPLPEAVIRVSHLIAEYVSSLSSQFDKVVIHALKVDNHSRLTLKKGTKRRGTNSWNHIIVELVQLLLESHKNISFEVYESAKAEIKIGDWTMLAEHGDGVKAYMGLPWYGFARDDGREAIKRMRANRPFDDRLRAHWHQAAAGPFGILCGCLCGSTELDAQAGRFSKPYQVSFLVHPKYGWYNFCRWDLSGIV